MSFFPRKNERKAAPIRQSGRLLDGTREGTRCTKEHPASGRRMATVHRTVAFYCSRPLHRECKNSVSRMGYAETGHFHFIHTLQGASEMERTLPRAKNSPPDCFLNALSSPALSRTKKEEHPIGCSSFLVRERGLEPPRRNHTHLKRACLPFQHSRKLALIL